MALSATVSTLAGEGDFIFSDELNHASIIDGCRRSAAKTVVYRHNDMADLEARLKETPAGAAKLIVTDGVFSMEGDICDLPAPAPAGRCVRRRLMVDDAHATGVLGRTGRGTAEHFGIEGKVDVTSGTLSKSMAAIGGFTGSAARGDRLPALQRPAVDLLGQPAAVGPRHRHRRARHTHSPSPGGSSGCAQNARLMSRGLKAAGFAVHDHGTPILPIAIGDDDRAYQFAGRLEAGGRVRQPGRYSRRCRAARR